MSGNRSIRRLVATMAAAALTVVGFFPTPAAAAWVCEITQNPDKFDMKPVTLTGDVSNLRPRVSRRGNPYYTFDLSAEGCKVHVFCWGHPEVRTGDPVEVQGTFAKVKRVPPRYTFYNEVECQDVKRR